MTRVCRGIVHARAPQQPPVPIGFPSLPRRTFSIVSLEYVPPYTMVSSRCVCNYNEYGDMSNEGFLDHNVIYGSSYHAIMHAQSTQFGK